MRKVCLDNKNLICINCDVCDLVLNKSKNIYTCDMVDEVKVTYTLKNFFKDDDGMVIRKFEQIAITNLINTKHPGIEIIEYRGDAKIHNRLYVPKDSNIINLVCIRTEINLDAKGARAAVLNFRT